MTKHALLVPVEGPIESFNLTNNSAQQKLESLGEGEYACICFTMNGGNELPLTVEFLINDEVERNPRARRTVARLTDLHIVLWGNVALTGIDETVLPRVVAELTVE